MGIEIAKTNRYVVAGLTGTIEIFKTNRYIVTNDLPAFPTPNIQAQKATALTVARFFTPNIDAQKATALTLINYPTPHVQVQMSRAMVVHRETAVLQAQKAAALVVCKGRTAHPDISPWTFTIDGHDFLVIQTYNETLIYDFSTEQWATWGGGETGSWRARLGQNWVANIGPIIATLGGINQTNVVCGDDTSDTLYFLDPELAEDYNWDGSTGKKFQRVLTGQIAIRGHDYQDVPAVDLTASNGELPVGADLDVDLQISDDKGHTYWSAGVQTVVAGEYDVTLSWRSLGSFTGPGRLFRFIDNGAIYRIDGMDIPDGN